jgi:hypothetical protein
MRSVEGLGRRAAALLRRAADGGVYNPAAIRRAASSAAASASSSGAAASGSGPSTSGRVDPEQRWRSLQLTARERFLQLKENLPAADPHGPMGGAGDLASAADLVLAERRLGTDARRLELARLLRGHNYSLPGLAGQTVLAKVLRVDRAAGTVLVDPGFYGVSEVPLSELSVAHVVHGAQGAEGAAHGAGAGGQAGPGSSSAPSQRDAIDDIRPGDTLRLRVDALYTPYGDMQLEPEQADAGAGRRRVWAELRAARVDGRPVSGRVLNACSGGYAVGVAGLVGLLPYNRCTAETAARVGQLAQFLVEAVDEGRGRLMLGDPKRGGRR